MNRISDVCAPFFPVKARRWWPLLCFCCCCCCRERETSHFFSAAFYLYLPNKFVLRFDWAVHPPLIVVSIQCFIAQHSLLFGNLSSKASLSQMHNEFPPFSSSIPFKLNIPLGSLWPRMRHHDHWLFSSFMTKRPQSIGRKEQRDQSKSSPKNVEVSCKWINGQWTRVSGHRFGLHNPTTSIHIIWRPKVQNRSDHVFFLSVGSQRCLLSFLSIWHYSTHARTTYIALQSSHKIVDKRRCQLPLLMLPPFLSAK